MTQNWSKFKNSWYWQDDLKENTGRLGFRPKGVIGVQKKGWNWPKYNGADQENVKMSLIVSNQLSLASVRTFTPLQVSSVSWDLTKKII